MRFLTSRQINKITKKHYERGLRTGYDMGYKHGWAERRRKDGLDAVVMAEIDDILRGAK